MGRRIRMLASVGVAVAVCSISAGTAAQSVSAARSLLLDSADAMGGFDKLRDLDGFSLTGFGQRYAANGALSADPMAPPKWQIVADAERFFDLRSRRALNRERNDNMFPFAASFGHTMNRSNQPQYGAAVLDHPLPALLAALDEGTVLGPVRTEDGMAVVEFTIASGETLWIGIEPASRLPYWTRRIAGDATLGDLTHTTFFTGYLPHDGIWLPTGIMSEIDWRAQTTLMFQVDSYRLDPELPEIPEPPASQPPAAPNVVVTEITDGIWDVAVVSGTRRDGGAVVEFSDHLVMFEPYGSAVATLARIDRANQLVAGKEVTAVIVSHHHSDHAAGVRAAVSRGITIIGHDRTRALFEEWVARPAVLYPDALARNPQPLNFLGVDEHRVLEDQMRRLDVYHAVGHMHMADALIAYLPEEQILMEGDFTDDTWEFNWWANAMRASIDRYDLDPELVIPVHGAVGTLDEKLARTAEQVRNAQAFCAELAGNGRYILGCPVQQSTDGPL